MIFSLMLVLNLMVFNFGMLGYGDNEYVYNYF